jgi:ubiquinone/menaquinone biosynthesis C-methylase UbiE
MDKKVFWDIRSSNYDKLFWVKDKSFLDTLIKYAEFKSDDIVLDVGTGTGVVGRAIKPHVAHVIGMDISDSMLKKGAWEDISVIKWNISDALFLPGLFDKITARMVFHHIFEELDRVIVRCFDLLKNGGKIIIAEGVPPTDDDEVVEWYTNMFKLKEERRTFKSNDLVYYLEKNSFKGIKQIVHTMENFSIRNWLENSGVEVEKREKILDMHINAPKKIKDVYEMKTVNNDCLIKTKNVIITGIKKVEDFSVS